jgi:hypothetical protein
MCEPSTLAMMSFALTAVSTVSSFFGAQQDADYQYAAADSEYIQLNQDLTDQSLEVDQSAGAEKSDIAIEALRAKGKAKVASSENAGMGLTTQLLLQDVYAQEGREQTAVETGRQRKQSQIEREREGLKNRYYQRTSQIQQPSLIGAGLQLAGAGVDAYGSVQKKKTDTKKKV